MKKRILIICCTFAATAILITGAYANQSISSILNNKDLDTQELQNALNSSTVLQSQENVVKCNNGFETINNENNIQTNISAYSTEPNNHLNQDNAIKIYSVSLLQSTDSLEAQLDKENELWMVPKISNGEMLYIFMRKGDDIETARENINALHLSDKAKEDMIKTATDRVGKWFVFRVDHKKSLENARAFVNANSISNMLDIQSISNVEDMKYVCVAENNTINLWVKTNNAEYIIPYNSIGDANNTVCTLSEYINNITK